MQGYFTVNPCGRIFNASQKETLRFQVGKFTKETLTSLYLALFSQVLFDRNNLVEKTAQGARASAGLDGGPNTGGGVVTVDVGRGVVNEAVGR